MNLYIITWYHLVYNSSLFKVGTALRTVNGMVFSCVKVENAAYGWTVSALEVTVFEAVSEGEQKFQ